MSALQNQNRQIEYPKHTENQKPSANKPPLPPKTKSAFGTGTGPDTVKKSEQKPEKHKPNNQPVADNRASFEEGSEEEEYLIMKTRRKKNTTKVTGIPQTAVEVAKVTLNIIHNIRREANPK